MFFLLGDTVLPTSRRFYLIEDALMDFDWTLVQSLESQLRFQRYYARLVINIYNSKLILTTHG